VAGGPIVASGAYWYWLGIEAAGDNNFYGLDGTLFGKGLPSLTSPYAHWVVSFQDTYNPTTLGCIIGHTGSAYTSYIGKHAMHVSEPALRVARSGMSVATVSCMLPLFGTDVDPFVFKRRPEISEHPRTQAAAPTSMPRTPPTTFPAPTLLLTGGGTRVQTVLILSGECLARAQS
jgi:hypothetical protein